MIAYPGYDPVLHDLFEPDYPNSPALWAVLKGNHTGLAQVDRPNHPRECVLRTDAALTYIGLNTSQTFLAGALARFRKKGPVWLVWPPQTALQPPDRAAAVIVPRLEFSDLDPNPSRLLSLKGQLPAGCQVRRIDAELFRRCAWREEMEFYTGSFDNFLKVGLGYCLMKEDEIIAEAYTSAFGKTRAEIGAITWEAYRGRGYAAITCAYLIEACVLRGYQPYWSCDADHTASIRVAQKLGFRQTRDYTIFEYPAFGS